MDTLEHWAQQVVRDFEAWERAHKPHRNAEHDLNLTVFALRSLVVLHARRVWDELKAEREKRLAGESG